LSANTYTGLMTPVVNSEYHREFSDEAIAERQKCFARSPMCLSSSDWSYKICTMVHSLKVDIEDEHMQANNVAQFKQELGFVQHCNHSGPIMVKLQNGSNENLAQLLNEMMPQHLNPVLVEVQMCSAKKHGVVYRDDIADEDDETDEEEQEAAAVDNWKTWQKFSSKMKHRVEVSEEKQTMTGDKETFAVLDCSRAGPRFAK